MATITLHGQNIETIGTLPQKGEEAKDFTLVGADLSDIKLSDLKGKRVILNIFPSIDTPTCATSVRTFNKRASDLENTIVLCISADLPFAGGRFCGAEGLDQVKTASTFRAPNFGTNYGVTITTGPLKGLLSRALVVLDENQRVIFTQQVPETGDEPDYEGAIKALA